MTAADRPSVTPQVGDTLTTAEQIDALPVGSVVLHDSDVDPPGIAVMQRSVHTGAWYLPAAVQRVEPLLPVTVLYVPGESSRPSVTDDALTECPFCDRIQRGDHRDDCGAPTVVHFEPLNPVTPGHMLFVPQWHTKHPDADAVAEAMRSAVRHAEDRGEDFNLITSSGPAATQTVEHVHVHYVPRRADDGLPLPWTPQQAAARAEATTATDEDALALAALARLHHGGGQA
ncbi:HIT family protein [Pseudactinotalea sp. Z1732]|uniref:HIT family protein n=1 Tax=Micrococcales TaxID=85006 RepID=UPI003C79D8C1